MKQKIFLVLAITASLISVMSCSESLKHGFDEDTELTSADLFVNSDEFNKFELLLTAKKKEITKAMLAVPACQRAKLRGYMQTLRENDDIDVRKEIMDSVQIMIGINLKESWAPVNRAAVEIIKAISGDIESFIVALQKRNARQLTLSRTDSEAEIAYSKCHSSCDTNYYINASKCNGLISGTVGHYGWQEYELCMYDVNHILMDCYASCETILLQ